MLRSAAFALSSLLLAGSALAADPLVDAEWLKSRLGSDNLVVIDLREPAKEGEADPYPAGHIPGAVAAPYAKAGWRATVNGIPGMLPPEADIEKVIGGLGVDRDDHVVIVSEGLTSTDFGAAARVYWTFDVLGHKEISVLEGGHAGWVAAGGQLETGAAPTVTATAYDGTLRPELIATIDDVKAAKAAGTPLVDARPAAQYAGTEIPKNVGIAGTIPGAVSLPHTVLVKEGRDVIDAAALGSLRSEIGVPESGEQIAFCNTGHWASVGWFLLNKVGGNDKVKLYDGSMVEWAKAAGQPTEVGATRTVKQ